MKLRMTIEAEVSELYFPETEEERKDLEETLRERNITISHYKDVIAKVTKVETIDYIMHEVKP